MRTTGFISLLCAAALACVLGAPAHVGASITPGSKNLGAIWFIGDSITQGNADQDSSGGMRATLRSNLNAAGYTFSFTGHAKSNTEGLPVTGSTVSDNLYQYHSGVSGSVIGTNMTLGGSARTGISQNITNWWTNATSRLSVVKPNVILLMIGANDAYFDVDITNAPSRLTQLINIIYNQPDVGNPTMLVATITPDRGTSTAPTNVAFFNAAVSGVVQYFRGLGKDVYIVDQFTKLNDNFNTAMILDSLMLHPNTVGNNFMASNWFNTIQGYIGETVPVPPYGLSATATNGLVSLAWSAVPGATNGYHVKRSLVSGGSYTSVVTNLTATSYTDTTIASLTTYYYVVTAINSQGESINSNQIAVTPSPSTMPTILACQVGGSTLNLSWPPNYLGWTLQTNAVGFIATNAWFPYPGSNGTTNLSIPIGTAATNVFFRMKYP